MLQEEGGVQPIGGGRVEVRAWLNLAVYYTRERCMQAGGAVHSNALHLMSQSPRAASMTSSAENRIVV
jgi:hypothetical protein